MWPFRQVCTVWWQKCFFLQVCLTPVDNSCMWQWHGPRVYIWRGREEGRGSAPSGCNGGPWHLTGLQQCGGQAGTDSHFGYVHIRSRSMAPPDGCHFLRSNTQTWRNRKERTVRHNETLFSATSHLLLQTITARWTRHGIYISCRDYPAQHNCDSQC